MSLDRSLEKRSPIQSLFRDFRFRGEIFEGGFGVRFGEVAPKIDG
jgi:hypothetical protein